MTTPDRYALALLRLERAIAQACMEALSDLTRPEIADELRRCADQVGSEGFDMPTMVEG